MQDIHITFPLDQLHALVASFEEQCAAQHETVVILDFGCSYKQTMGYLVLEWDNEVDPAFIDHLTGDSTIIDFSIYSVPCTTDDLLADPFCPSVS